MIELQHLTKRFATQGGTVIALNDINLTIRGQRRRKPWCYPQQ